MSEKVKSQKEQELETLQQAQLNNEAPTITANKNADYQIAEAEKEYVHVVLTTKTYNPTTKKIDEASRTIAVRPAEFKSMEENNAFASYDSQEIIHDPRSKSEIKATASGSGNEPQAPKNKTEWQARYTEVIGEDAGNLTIAEMQKAIEEKEGK